MAARDNVFDGLRQRATQVEKLLRDRGSSVFPPPDAGADLASLAGVRDSILKLEAKTLDEEPSTWLRDRGGPVYVGAAELGVQLVDQIGSLGATPNPISIKSPMVAAAPPAETKSVVSDVKWSIWGVAAVLVAVIFLKRS